MEGFTSMENEIFFCRGKDILVKSVVQIIPAYAMSCFHLLKGLCLGIMKLCARFWLGE